MTATDPGDSSQGGPEAGDRSDDRTGGRTRDRAGGQADDRAGEQHAGGERGPVRGPVLDRLSAGVAVAGLLLLATNQAPPLADYGTLAVALACLGVGILVGLVGYRLVGPLLLGPLWIGVVTAVALAVPLLAVLYLIGSFEPWYVWAASLGPALFGAGAATRAALTVVASRS